MDACFFLVASIPLAGIAYEGSNSLWATALLVAAGYASWTLFEYAMHRWIFHNGGPLEKAHWQHHVDETIGAPNWMSIASFVLLFWLLTMLVDFVFAATVLLGVSIGYLVYLGVHSMCHNLIVYPDEIFYETREHHLRHHHYASGNYGVTNSILDRVFGTRL